MKKTLQRQLLEMLQTLEEGIRYIGQEGNPAMLRECITAIRAIRETCQQSLPVKRQAVYVDLFDGMAQALQQLPDQADQATLQQTTDLCQELIEYARQALQKELTRKKIMVFLPYKASMWDSLESVWKAAYEDKEHCETYVIPIPYCDRNPDMTAKEWHCEAGLFPDYVPVLDWREYSRDKLREMHPDVIFIHNPYDNFNAVTSVDMQYYSRNLKGIAEKLVYIPYFVVGDTIAPHFCQTQGVINADYVIVQDENIKEQYERYYPGGNPSKGKILALGSPKFDKVCNTTKDDYILPEEWQRLIGNKKVILYNTSLTAMLEHTDKFNAKLRYVFDAFKQRDDVVLWWRPHPLLRATIDSMTPEIRDEYRQIEQAYINEGWGIYDDTPDMDRAIVCTDAYYGDMSSLVWLYQKTGKPIVQQSFATEPVSVPLGPNQMQIFKGKLYFVSRFVDYLLQMDMYSNKIIWHKLNGTERKEVVDSFGGINILPDDKLLIAPFESKDFIKFDLKTNQQELLYTRSIFTQKVASKFRFGITYKHKIIYYGFSRFCIVVYDIIKQSFHCVKMSFDLEFESSNKDEWYHYEAATIAGHMLIGVRGTSNVIDLNMDTEELSVLDITQHISSSDRKIASIGANGNFVCFMMEGNQLVVWNYARDEWMSVILSVEFSKNAIGQLILLVGDQNVYLLKMAGTLKEYYDMEYLSLQLDGLKFGKVNVLHGIKAVFSFSKQYGECFALVTAENDGDRISFVDLATCNVLHTHLISLENLPDDVFGITDNHSRCLCEKPDLLNKLLKYVKNTKADNYPQNVIMGENIYHCIRDCEEKNDYI